VLAILQILSGTPSKYVAKMTKKSLLIIENSADIREGKNYSFIMCKINVPQSLSEFIIVISSFIKVKKGKAERFSDRTVAMKH
jgi:hypothetical protein